MQTESNRIEILFSKYLQNTISREELSEFWSLLPSQPNETLSTQLQNLWLQTEGTTPVITGEEWDRKLKALIEKAGREDAGGIGRKGRKEHAKNATIRRIWIRWVAAACIVLTVGVLANVWWKNKHTEQPAIAQQTHDVPAPSNTRAVITLANGSKVYLDSASNGTIAQENNVNIVKNNEGGISYLSPAGGGDLSASPNNKRPGVDYNTLFNPRGSKVISLTLSDGTKVWLNSESSLKYPIAFNTNTREVEITGEAYFEVKHNAKQPFKVHLPNGSIVEDIGTAFNVNAYTDEADIKTTLIEGSVKVVTEARGPASRDPRQTPGVDKEVILKPGQQAMLTANGQWLTANPDLDEVTAWKNGRFQFTDVTIDDIMKEISRYYDAEIIYQDKIPGHFVADISRDVPVSKLLQILELTNRVHFKIEGKKITVMK